MGLWARPAVPKRVATEYCSRLLLNRKSSECCIVRSIRSTLPIKMLARAPHNCPDRSASTTAVSDPTPITLSLGDGRIASITDRGPISPVFNGDPSHTVVALHGVPG